ncbi:amyloid-beta A4 precursor protein-binding family B member 3 [Menidia menidia]
MARFSDAYGNMGTTYHLWTDLQPDLDLPPGWRTIRDSVGTYYWHVPTGATQWQRPLSAQQEEAADQSPPQEPPGPPPHRYPPSWSEDHVSSHGPESKCFAVRSLGWLPVQEEDLCPGRSSLAVSSVIQQLSHCSPQGGGGRDLVLVLKKDSLLLLDPLDRTPLHSQPIRSLRVWGVGCNSGRDFAFVAADKDGCLLKCHVFRCDAPARTIAATLQGLCSQMVSEAPLRASRSLTMESISPEDLPRQVEFLEAVRQQVQKFQVQYIGTLPVSRAMGMAVLNRAIESIMSSTERDEWTPAVIHVSSSRMSLWGGQEGAEPLWDLPVRFLSFLGVGHDSRTFAVILDGGAQRFQCHAFWCQPHAGGVSEALQAACMVQYQKCLVAQTPPPRSKSWRAAPAKVRRANSMDGAAFPPNPNPNLNPNPNPNPNPALTSSGSPKGAGMRRSMMAFFQTFRSRQATTSW